MRISDWSSDVCSSDLELVMAVAVSDAGCDRLLVVEHAKCRDHELVDEPQEEELSPGPQSGERQVERPLASDHVERNVDAGPVRCLAHRAGDVVVGREDEVGTHLGGELAASRTRIDADHVGGALPTQKCTHEKSHRRSEEHTSELQSLMRN